MPARPKPDNLPTEETIDEAIELSFPASDPPAYGSPTGTEPPTQPTDRRSPLPSRGELDAVAQLHKAAAENTTPDGRGRA